MICTIIDIRGDYAYVRYQDTGVVSEVAIALLPFGVDVGDTLKFENYELRITNSPRYKTSPCVCALSYAGGICFV